MKKRKVNLNKLFIGTALVLIALFLYLPFGTMAEIIINGDPVYEYEWNGQGKDSLDGSKAGEGDRPDDGSGWIHWVFTSKGDSTAATLTLGMSGSGTYEPGNPLNAEVWHFYTPYFDVDELTATITLHGGDKGPGVGLVISDYWPGEEQRTPQLIIEKELLDLEENLVADDDTEFEFVISGGAFADGETFSFSVNEPRTLGEEDGLQFEVEYSITEVEHAEYEFVSTSQTEVTLTEETTVITVIIVNQEKEEPEEERGVIIIEKIVKVEVDDEELIPSNKTFTFNIYNNETDETVQENVELEVVDGKGFVEVEGLPLAVYRVEEMSNGGYVVHMDPEDGIVDLTSAENNTVTVVITNTPRPQLIIEKVLLDTDQQPVENSDILFTVFLDGGLFDDSEISFSVNEPAVLDYSDGLEFDVLYTVTEVENESYPFVSIDPDEAFMLSDDNYEITVTVTNRIPEAPEDPPQTPETPEIPFNPPLVLFIPPDPPESEPEEEPEVVIEEVEIPVGGTEEEISIEPEEPLTEPESELVVAPEAPLATPQTDGISPSALWLGIIMLGSGMLLRLRKNG